MIGVIHITDSLTASLDDSGRWSCANKRTEEQLNSLFRPEDGAGLTAILPPGEAVARAARFYGAHAELSQEPRGEVVLFTEDGEVSPEPYRGERIKSLAYDAKARQRKPKVSGPCEDGQTAAQTGCTPKGKKPRKLPKQSQSPSVYSDSDKKPKSEGDAVSSGFTDFIAGKTKAGMEDRVIVASRKFAGLSDEELESAVYSTNEEAKKSKKVDDRVIDSVAALLLHQYRSAEKKREREEGAAASRKASARAREDAVTAYAEGRDTGDEAAMEYAEAYHALKAHVEEGGVIRVQNAVRNRWEDRGADLEFREDGTVTANESLRSRKRVTLDPQTVISWAGGLKRKNPLPPKAPESPSKDKWPDTWPENSGQYYWEFFGAWAALSHPVSKRKPKSKAEGDAMLPYVEITDKAKARILKAKNQKEADVILAEMNRELDALNDAVDAVAEGQEAKKHVLSRTGPLDQVTDDWPLKAPTTDGKATWPDEITLGELKKEAKRRLGRDYAGTAVVRDVRAGRAGVVVNRIKHGQYGTSKVRAVYYPIPLEPKEDDADDTIVWGDA